MSDYRKSSGSSEHSLTRSDDPPYSRLFIVCSKHSVEDDFRSAFEKFGTIEEIRVVQDRHTGDSKGIVYIKFAKTSEAAKALEEMNGHTLGNSSNTRRAIRVIVAASRDQGSLKRDGNESEKYTRLFVIIPKSMNESDLTEEFRKFGSIDYVTIIKDKTTRESKGFAYVKFFSFYHAALAYEKCERKYRAVFAEPKPVKHDDNKAFYDFNRYNSSSSSNYPAYGNSSLSVRDIIPTGDNFNSPSKLLVTASLHTNQDQMWKLFDIIPGLDYCHLSGNRGSATNLFSVAYSSQKSANYAKEKLHGFEYPPGYRLIVKSDPESFSSSNDTISRGLQSATTILSNPSGINDIAQLAETIAQATSLIQAAGLQVPVNPADKLKLPPPQPLVDLDSAVALRLFVVCDHTPPPIQTLRDVFCRFGNLIDIYMIFNKNCGFAKYASRESALTAMEVLHGAYVGDVRLKVMEADEPRSHSEDDRRKRVKREEAH